MSMGSRDIESQPNKVTFMRRAFIAIGIGCFALSFAACSGGSGEPPNRVPGQPAQSAGAEDAGGGATGNSTTPDGGATVSDASADSAVTKTTLSASEFDQSCDIDSDCVPVYEGSVCAACRCAEAAIATKDASQYAAELAERAKSCPAPKETKCPPCDPAFPVASCDPTTKKCYLSSRGDR
jgi:hypothetical protein